MKIDNKLLKKVVRVFTLVSDYFYSLAGRKLLAQEEIEARTYFCTQSSAKIPKKEIVFRSLWEISKLPKDYWNVVLKLL